MVSRLRSLTSLGTLLLGLGVVACSAKHSAQTTSTTGAGDSTGNGLGLSGGGDGVGGGSLNPTCDNADPNVDNDGDGWTTAQGDCNDCTAQINPGARDFPGNGVDEDCNGAIDDDPTGCDSGLNVQSSNALDGAKAIGLCKMQSGDSYGLETATYVTADGKPLGTFDPQGLGHGILGGFGSKVHPQEGAKLLALSSGTARNPTDPGYQSVAGYDKGYPGFGFPSTSAPAGFPKESPSCPGVTTGAAHDSVGLLVKMRTPTNAKSVHFNLNFYTYEFPVYICSTFNDFFVALMDPVPAGQSDGNISFDSQGNLISVNAGFLSVCHKQKAGGKNFACSLGPDQLAGTGFDVDDYGDPTDNSAATGWLETTAPIANPGKDISLLFTIWDSGDGELDSTILLDNFGFDVTATQASTAPIPTPK